MMTEFQHIPIIAISASVLETERLKSNEAGCNEFLSKPIDSTILFDKLKEHLQLSWVYEHSLTTMKPVVNSDDHLVIPPKAELGAIFEALDVGDFNAIEQEAQRLNQLDSQYQGFVYRLLDLAQAFDEQSILKLLQGLANNNPKL